METLELIAKIGSVLGFISTAIALFALLKTKTNSYIAKESGKEERKKADEELNARLDALEKQMSKMTDTFSRFKQSMEEHIDGQRETSKRMLASIIESTYYANRSKRTLDLNEFKRITETYDVYHSEEIHGNNYITAIYEEMLTWDRVD